MKLKVTLFFAFCLIVFIIPFVSAQQIYKQNTDVDLKVPCFNNNTYCSASSVCNITIINFDREVIVDNLEMTRQTAYHNYTLNTSQTSELGEYTTTVVCFDNNNQGYSTFNYIITPTGKANDLSSALTQAIILLVMFGVTIFFLFFGGLTESPGVKLFFNMISYITMALTVGTAYILLQNSGIQSNISSTVYALIYIIGIVLVIIMFYIFINQTRQVLNLMKIKKGYGSEFDNAPTF